MPIPDPGPVPGGAGKINSPERSGPLVWRQIDPLESLLRLCAQPAVCTHTNITNYYIYKTVDLLFWEDENKSSWQCNLMTMTTWQVFSTWKSNGARNSSHVTWQLQLLLSYDGGTFSSAQYFFASFVGMYFKFLFVQLYNLRISIIFLHTSTYFLHFSYLLFQKSKTRKQSMPFPINKKVFLTRKKLW